MPIINQSAIFVGSVVGFSNSIFFAARFISAEHFKLSYMTLGTTAAIIHLFNYHCSIGLYVVIDP
jgi:hypothetical protein